MNNLNLSEKEAALLVYIMWSWLAKHPGKLKPDFPLHAKLRFHTFYNNCPWCTLYEKCATCVLYKNDYSCRCADPNSNYALWLYYTVNVRYSGWKYLFKWWKVGYYKRRASHHARKIANIALDFYEQKISETVSRNSAVKDNNDFRT